MATARFEVFGRVQGVGFRFFVQRQAQALALAGWVRNCDNGSVEVCAEGTAEALSRLEQQLRVGPAAAAVSQVRRSAGPHGEQPVQGFRILD